MNTYLWLFDINSYIWRESEIRFVPVVSVHYPVVKSQPLML